MRTSHKKINQLINDEVETITDEELFSSSAYAAYLTDIVEATTIQKRKKVRVKLIADMKPNAPVAYTDNREITMNVLNRITSSYPTRALKSISLLGLLGHEKGHIDYTDFTTLAMFMQAVDNSTMYPHVPKDLEDADNDNLEKYLEILQ